MEEEKAAGRGGEAATRHGLVNGFIRYCIGRHRKAMNCWRNIVNIEASEVVTRISLLLQRHSEQLLRDALNPPSDPGKQKVYKDLSRKGNICQLGEAEIRLSGTGQWLDTVMVHCRYSMPRLNVDHSLPPPRLSTRLRVILQSFLVPAWLPDLRIIVRKRIWLQQFQSSLAWPMWSIDPPRSKMPESR